MLSMLRTGRDRKEDGVATPVVAAVAAAVLVVLALSAVVLSITRQDNASVASKSEPESAGPEATAEMMTSAKNAATAMESWAVENGGTYMGVCDGATSTPCRGLVEHGLKLPPEVTVVVVSADSDSYCLRATHADVPPEDAVFYSSDVGTPSNEPCI